MMASNPAADGPHSAVVHDDGFEQENVKYFLVTVSGSKVASGASWQVRRRYNDFQRLHDQLARQRVLLPPMPPKSFFRLMLSGDFREERRRQLQNLLQTAMQSDPSLLYLQELQAFLGVQGPPPMPPPAQCPPFSAPVLSAAPEAQAMMPAAGQAVPVVAQAMPAVAQAAPAVAQATPEVAQVPAAPMQPLQHAPAYAQAAPVYAQQQSYAQPASAYSPYSQAPMAYAQPVGAYPGTGPAYAQPAPAYGFAAPVYAAPPMYDARMHHQSQQSYGAGNMVAAAAGAGAAGLVGGMLLESMFD